MTGIRNNLTCCFQTFFTSHTPPLIIIPSVHVYLRRWLICYNSQIEFLSITVRVLPATKERFNVSAFHVNWHESQHNGTRLLRRS